jgi:VCBS repeat-containing protein
MATTTSSMSGALVGALTGELQVAQLGGGTAAAMVIGRVTKLTGDATAIRNGVSIQLNMGDTVNKGDVVQAGSDSSLGLTFIDGTVFGLSSNARMVLNEMVYDPNGSSNSSLLSLVQGTITFVAGETAKHGDMKIDTPVATMGIRGTAVLVEIAFNLPGSDPSTSLPVKFQVLREPDGSVGSYVLYSKTDPTQAIATINRAGEVTSYSANGVLSVAQVALLAPEAKAIVDQTLQLYFPTYTPSPQSTSPSGSPPADPTQNIPKLDPIKFTPPDSQPVGPPIVVPINLPGNGPATPPVNVTITRFNTAPTIVVAPVVVTLPVDKTSFYLADQVTINDPDNTGGVVNDVAVPYVAGTGKVMSATGPAGGPASADLAKLVTVDPTTGDVSYDPGAFKFLPAGKSVVFTIGFDSRSGPDTVHETVTFTVDGNNDAPVIAAALTATAHEGDAPFTVDLLAGALDPDLGETATLLIANVRYKIGNGSFSNVAPPGVALTGATLSVDPGNPAFAHLALGEATDVVVTYDVTDVHGAKVTQTETVTVTGTNDAPVVAAALTANVIEGNAPLAVNLLSGATDVDTGETGTLVLSNVTWIIGNGPASAAVPAGLALTGATLNIDADHPAFAHLALGETTKIVVTYDVTDVHGAKVTQTESITVTGTNDAPVIATALTANTSEGSAPFAVNLLSGATDIDTGETATLALSNVSYNVGNGVASAVLPAGLSLTAGILAVDPANAAFNHLAPGETIKIIASYDVTDVHGATVAQTETIIITGTNDAPVATPAILPDGIEDTAYIFTSAALLGSVSDPDGTLPTISDVTVQSGGGSIVHNIDGTWSYTPAANYNGPVVFAYTATDGTLSATSMATLTLAPVNDTPTITSGTATGTVTEDQTTTTVTGQLVATDPDPGDHLTWSVTSSTPGGSANYHFVMDSFVITRNGSAYFTDDFSDGNPPPSDPSLTVGSGYGGIGGFTETGGKLYLDGSNAAVAFGVGTSASFVAQDAVLRTNIDPTSSAGLKQSVSFVVSGVFDLILPSSINTEYGIRLTDRLIGGNGTPPDQAGDDTISLTVRENANGNVVVALRDIDFLHDTITTIGSMTLAAPTGTDQIALHLNHVAGSMVVTASFDYLHLGSVISTQTFSSTASLFNGENWTRAEFIAVAPATNTDPVYGGTFGALTIDQTGAWTYTLDNNRATTQSLAKGQHATDSFTVQVADASGAVDARVINIDVVGSNDAPILQVTSASATLLEQSATPDLRATGLAQFYDVDLTDTHSVAATLQSSMLSGNGALPPGLSALLDQAMTATIAPETGDGHGQLQWNFDIAGNAVQFLTSGQTLTLNYHVVVTDTNGASAFENVSITVTGTNEAPVILTDGTTTSATCAVSGGQNIASGAILFADPDLTDSHTASAVYTGGGTALGNLTLNYVRDTSVVGPVGEFDWSYAAATTTVEAALLGSGTGAFAETFTVTIDDGHGGTVSRNITVDLSADRWIGSTGNWSAGSNWSLGYSPIATGIVMFNSSANVTLDFAFATAGLVVAADVTATLSGGNQLEVTGAAINRGTIVVASDAILKADGAIDNSVGAITIETGGTLTLNSATISGGTITDVGTSTFGDAINLAGNATISDGTLFNSGEFTVGGTGNALVNEQFFNYATMSVQIAGVLTLTNSTVSGGYLHNAGTLHVEGSTGASLNGVTLDGGGTLQVDDEAIPIYVTLTLSGGTTIENGTLSIGDIGAVDISDSASFYNEIVVNSGVISVLFGATLTLGNVTVSGGALNIEGTLQIAANSIVTLNSDTISEGESGSVSVGAGATLVVATDDADLNIAADSGAIVNVTGSNETLHITGDATVTFTGSGNLVFVNDVLVSNGSHVAVIGTPTHADVTEDAATPMLTAVGSITISDADAREGSFQTMVTAAEGNLGHLVLAADGSYSYSVVNSDVQYLSAAATHVDTFTVAALDGTSKDVNFTIHGINDAPALAGGSVTIGAVDVPLNTVSGAVTAGAAAILAAGPGLISGIGGATGYGNLALQPNDDNSTGAIDITSVFGEAGVNFFGTNYRSIFINNNGNITFKSATGAYTPSEINAGLDNPIIAAFWADVDTTGHGAVYYDLDSVDGVMTITWDQVGYYSGRVDKLNSFQIVLVNEGGGNFDIVYRYADINWTTGSASGGVNGLGGVPARAGYSAGDNSHYYELPQSGDQNALLHLPATLGNTGIAGVDTFQVHDGSVGPSAVASLGIINFSDSDLNDVHTAHVNYTGHELGTLTLSKVTDTTGTGIDGQFAWTYTANAASVAAALQDDADGIRIDTFDVVIADGAGGTISQTVSVTLNGTGNHSPFIDTSHLQVSAGEQQGAPVILSGISVSDVDTSSSSFVLALTAGHGSVAAADGSPLAGAFTSLADLNAHLSGGLVYTGQDATPQDSITLAVRDSQGASSTMNFVFNVSQTGPVTLDGTAGNDVILGTGHQDTMTGGAGRDQFVFAENLGHDTITDFHQDELDRIDLSAVVTTNDLNGWFNEHVKLAANQMDTLITIDANDSILLHHVTGLTASDLMVHQYQVV